jgi:hypothetical protein
MLYRMRDDVRRQAPQPGRSSCDALTTPQAAIEGLQLVEIQRNRDARADLICASCKAMVMAPPGQCPKCHRTRAEVNRSFQISESIPTDFHDVECMVIEKGRTCGPGRKRLGEPPQRRAQFQRVAGPQRRRIPCISDGQAITAYVGETVLTAVRATRRHSETSSSGLPAAKTTGPSRRLKCSTTTDGLTGRRRR